MTAIPGIRLATAAAGIRYQGRDDLLLIELSDGGTVTGTASEVTISS